MNEYQEPVTGCCGAQFYEYDNDIGICMECNDWATAEEEEKTEDPSS